MRARTAGAKEKEVTEKEVTEKEVEWKVVETSYVTDEELTLILNEWTARGWSFEGFHFAMRDASRRPAMVFVTFTRMRACAPEQPAPAELEPVDTVDSAGTDDTPRDDLAL